MIWFWTPFLWLIPDDRSPNLGLRVVAAIRSRPGLKQSGFG